MKYYRRYHDEQIYEEYTAEYKEIEIPLTPDIFQRKSYPVVEIETDRQEDIT